MTEPQDKTRNDGPETVARTLTGHKLKRDPEAWGRTLTGGKLPRGDEQYARTMTGGKIPTRRAWAATSRTVAVGVVPDAVAVGVVFAGTYAAEVAGTV